MKKGGLAGTPRRRMGMQLFISLTSMTILLYVFFTLIIVYRQQAEIKESLIKEGQSLATICSESLRAAVFAEDKAMIETIVQGIISRSGIMSVSVFNDAGKALFLWNKLPLDTRAVTVMPEYSPMNETDNSFSFMRPVVIEVPYNVETTLYADNPPKYKKTAGYVCLVVDKVELNAALKRAVLLNTLVVVIFIIAIAAAIYFTVMRIAGPFEFRMAELEKMEAVGTLARGIAHDFNNILGASKGYMYVLKKKLGEDDLLKYVNYAEKSLERGKSLVESLLSFSNTDTNKFALLDLNEIVKSLRQTIEPLVAENCDYTDALSEGSLIIKGDRLQLEQVVLNLVSNAVDAMGEEGSLNIQTGKAVFDSKVAAIFCYPSWGEFACLKVHDSGGGIDAAIKSKIFEPFFTTKEVGKGTGLGLSIVYGVIKEHNGFIDIESSKENGTTFKVYLPLEADKTEIRANGGQGE